MAKPKLALIPAAQGSKFYSVLPSSGVGDFDFTRSGSATRINSQGLIETVANGVSRLNYPLIDGKVVGCPHHILEPQRTNLITYSEDFSQSVWNKANLIVSLNTTISPDGTLNASTITTSNTSHSLYFNLTVVASTQYTLSFYAKRGTMTNLKYRVYDLSNDGDIVAPTSYYSETSSDIWERVTLTFTTPSGCTSARIYPVSNSDATGTMFLFGCMLEQSSYPTSYIPTNGSIATRSAETANGSGNSEVFNDSEGVLFADISALANDGTSRRISISDGSTSNRVSIEIDETADILKLFIDTHVLQADNIELTNFTKICGKYKANDYALWVNGFEVATITNQSNVPTGLDKLNFDGGDGSNDFYGKTKEIGYYDTALTDSELETLTSWVSFSDMANGQLYTIQ